MESIAHSTDLSRSLCIFVTRDVRLKSRVWENCTHGSVRDVQFTVGGKYKMSTRQISFQAINAPSLLLFLGLLTFFPMSSFL
jgi:hypothetical protein